jgi:hypothetical protein
MEKDGMYPDGEITRGAVFSVGISLRLAGAGKLFPVSSFHD